MPQRRILCLFLILPVFFLIVSPVPAGHGPFSAAYGPATKFQTLQTLLLLLFLISVGITISVFRTSVSLVSSTAGMCATTRCFASLESSPFEIALRC